MKKFLLICCMLLFLCSCTQGPVTEDNIPPNNSYEKDSASADAEEINITSMLSLQQDQSYVVCDYFEGNVLILISDSSKQNSNDITDQATTVFFEEFVVLNIQTQSIINRYPIQEFGICPSAIQAFGGVVYPFFSVGTNQMDSQLYLSIVAERQSYIMVSLLRFQQALYSIAIKTVSFLAFSITRTTPLE